MAIKILRPDIKKIFNEEIDALMLFAFNSLSLLSKKTKRLKLIEVVFLLKEITNLEMDLDLKLLQQMNMQKTLKMMLDLEFLKFIGILHKWKSNDTWLDWWCFNSWNWTFTKKNINTERIASDIIQHFLRHAVRDGFFHADMHQGNIFIDNNGANCTNRFWYNGKIR